MTKPKSKSRSNRAYVVSRVRKYLINGTAILTATSKMPGPSFSLPAKRSCPNSRGTVCDGVIDPATKKRIGGCYALKGCYRYTSTANAQDKRYKWVIRLLRTAEGRAHFVDRMIETIKGVGAPYFRGHDSGDFFNIEYILAWVEICRRLPTIKFWFPTREWQLKSSADPFAMYNPRMDALQILAGLPNVTVRPSALDVGAPSPIVPGLAAGSTVNGGGFQCPAIHQNHECRDCRVCWNSPDVPVSYSLH
jgi:Gene product 88